jgi:predicted nucleotidyltransferase component of viral defense system
VIPQAYITEWRNIAPWRANEQVEQDLVISRALVEIYNDPVLAECLAFRGGTALHKLFMEPQPRYSEDIDLVQIPSEPIKESLVRIGKALSFLGRPSVDQKQANNTMRFRFESEIPPVQRLRLKIEINCREHFTELGIIEKQFAVASSWFTGECRIRTFELEELLGSKMRALYQRSKGRDLYDLNKALTNAAIDPQKILKAIGDI